MTSTTAVALPLRTGTIIIKTQNQLSCRSADPDQLIKDQQPLNFMYRKPLVTPLPNTRLLYQDYLPEKRQEVVLKALENLQILLLDNKLLYH